MKNSISQKNYFCQPVQVGPSYVKPLQQCGQRQIDREPHGLLVPINRAERWFILSLSLSVCLSLSLSLYLSLSLHEADDDAIQELEYTATQSINQSINHIISTRPFL